MLCDNFFRCVVDLRHKERGYDAEAALDDLLVANFERLQKFLADLILGADRGYVKTHLWSLLARHAAGFVLIADPEFTTTGHPLIGATSRAAAKHPAAFRVPDGAMLGMGVATATTTVDVPGRDPSRVYAYAVRTQTTVTKKQKSAGGTFRCVQSVARTAKPRASTYSTTTQCLNDGDNNLYTVVCQQKSQRHRSPAIPTVYLPLLCRVRNGCHFRVHNAT